MGDHRNNDWRGKGDHLRQEVVSKFAKPFAIARGCVFHLGRNRMGGDFDKSQQGQNLDDNYDGSAPQQCPQGDETSSRRTSQLKSDRPSHYPPGATSHPRKSAAWLVTALARPATTRSGARERHEPRTSRRARRLRIDIGARHPAKHQMHPQSEKQQPIQHNQAFPQIKSGHWRHCSRPSSQARNRWKERAARCPDNCMSSANANQSRGHANQAVRKLDHTGLQERRQQKSEQCQQAECEDYKKPLRTNPMFRFCSNQTLSRLRRETRSNRWANSAIESCSARLEVSGISANNSRS